MRRGSLFRLALLALIWGSSFLWIKVALRGLSPVQVVLVRLALGALVLLAFCYARGLKLPGGWGLWLHLTVAALFANAVPYFLFALGEEAVDSSLARVSGLALGFGGTLLILAPWEATDAGSTWGALACLGAALNYGISYVYMDRFLAGRGIPPVVLSAAQLTAATGLLVVVTPFAGLQPVNLRLDALASAAILGALGTGTAYVLNYQLITDGGATAASTVTYLLPIVSAFLGATVLGERLGPHVLPGMAVVLAGVALARRRPQPAAAAGPAPGTMDAAPHPP